MTDQEIAFAQVRLMCKLREAALFAVAMRGADSSPHRGSRPAGLGSTTRLGSRLPWMALAESRCLSRRERRRPASISPRG